MRAASAGSKQSQEHEADKWAQDETPKEPDVLVVATSAGGECDSAREPDPDDHHDPERTVEIEHPFQPVHVGSRCVARVSDRLLSLGARQGPVAPIKLDFIQNPASRGLPRRTLRQAHRGTDGEQAEVETEDQAQDECRNRQPVVPTRLG